jgi:hypothetical protein
LSYQGAFKMPTAPFGWQFSNGGMAFYPAGNGGAGSLFVFGHAQRQNIGEIAIPTTLKKLSDGYTKAELETATALRDLAWEDPQTTFAPGIGGPGLEYVAAVNKLYFTRPGDVGAGWCDLDGGNPQGLYGLAGVDDRGVGDFLTTVPATWEGYSAGGVEPTKVLVTGANWEVWSYGVKTGIFDYQ